MLDAALGEFAEHGLAGARVDRIGAAAGANKRLIYVYFTNKEQLSGTVVAHSLNQIAEVVPFTSEDLPGYSGALVDHLLAHPEHLKLTVWAQLERPIAATRHPAPRRLWTRSICWPSRTGDRVAQRISSTAGDLGCRAVLARAPGPAPRRPHRGRRSPRPHLTEAWA